MHEQTVILTQCHRTTSGSGVNGMIRKVIVLPQDAARYLSCHQGLSGKLNWQSVAS
jgi:hypothetical protein